MLMLVVALAMLLNQPSVDFRSTETARIRRHLALVEAALRATDVSSLTRAQREARARNLDVLHAYWTRGAFPVNTDFPGRRIPYFIDRHGTRCAMAYLIEQSGRGDLVQRIAVTQNNAYVRDLENDAELGAWLRENGLTAAEAARIQPSYGSPEDDFAGRWNGTVTFDSQRNVKLRYILTNEESRDAWMLTFPERGTMQMEVVALEGDSLVLEAPAAWNMFGAGEPVTLSAVLHYGGNTLTGSMALRYASGAVVRGMTSATLECAGQDSPEPVVAFVRRLRLPQVRCMTESAAGGDWSVHQVLYRNEGGQFRYAARDALLWHGRVGWIANDAMETDSAAGMFRARSSDTALMAPALLNGLTPLGLRLRLVKTLLQDPNVPRFVPLVLIAALHDSVEVPLAELLVASPQVTRDPSLLAALVRLPVAPDSTWRRSDGGMVYATATTGYAHARNAAESVLWSQSLALIAAPRTSHDVLLTIATWRDRYRWSCPGRPGLRAVFAALEERATRDHDAAVLDALKRHTTPNSRTPDDRIVC